MKLRFVKFFTSRENEIEKKEEGGRRPNITCSTATQLGRAQRSRSAPAPRSSLHHSHSLSLHPAHQPASPRPSLSAATDRESNALQLSPPPAVPLLPSFFIKLPKRKSVEGRTGEERPACRPSCNRRAPSSPHPCPFIQSGGPRLLSGSNGALSVAGGAIGKQRPEKNYPVPSPSLTNK